MEITLLDWVLVVASYIVAIVLGIIVGYAICMATRKQHAKPKGQPGRTWLKDH